MIITIYDSAGNPKVDLSPNDSSTQVKEVQGDSVLTLSFTLYEHIELDVDDYADFLGERFWLTEKYRPRQNSRKEWVYDLKLYGVESMIKRLLVIKTVDNEENPVFSLTAPPHEHVAMIVKCMNEGMGNITDWKVGQVNGTENIVIDYSGKYCDEALKEIAEKVGAEWWVEGQTVNICKCEHGEPVELGYLKGLQSIDPGTADNVKFYTRLYPVGSSRNIDREKYGFTRLQLPGGQKYVEINADKYGRVDHFEQSAFEGIYPRRVGSVSSVRSEVKTGDDGTPFTIYYFTDNSLPFDPNDYMIGGLVIRVSFQEGSELAGLGEEDNGTYFFEVNFNSSTREFEIITIWPYDNDMQLPGDKLIPKIGDKYILWNLRMPDEYYALAEEEFLTAVNQYNADHNLDISVYKAPTDHVWIEDNEVVLTIGQRIRLESEEYFPETGYRDSRITKITRKVNLPSSMDIEISDALSRTSMQKVSDSIDDVRSYTKSIGESINLPDIIKTGDKTRAADTNLLSALRTYRDMVRKDKPDSTPYQLGVGSLKTNNFVSGLFGGIGAGIDERGNAEFESAVIRTALTVMELVINRQSVMGGDSIFSEGGTIENAEFVTANPDGTQQWMLELKEQYEGEVQEIQPGMVVRGVVNNLFDAAIEGSPALYYTSWMRVNGAELGTSGNRVSVTLYPDNEVPSGKNYPPCALMKLARWGHQTNEALQRLFMLSSHEGTLIRYEGVDKPIIDIGNIASLIGRAPAGLFDDIPGVKAGDEVAYFKTLLGNFIQTDHKGKPVPTIIDTGIYDPTRSYRHEAWNEDGSQFLTEDCWYLGCRWRCMVDGTVGVEPGYGVTAWGFVSGDPSFIVDFEEKVIVYDQRQLQTFGATLTLTATKYNCDVLPFIKSDNIQGGRESYDSHGALRTESDMAWKPTTDKGNKRLLLSFADLGYDGTPIGKITFWARVALDDADVQTIGVEIS